MALIARKQAVARILPDSGEEWGGYGMPVIAVASPVAGSGRTTLAAHLAVEAGRTGNGPVMLLDPEPGSALAQWISVRNRPAPEGRLFHCAHMRSDLPDLENAGVQLCVADSVSTKQRALRPMVDMADLVVIPCPLERKALKAAAKYAGTVRDSGSVAAVVVTRAVPGEEFWNETTRTLKKEELLCQAVLHRDDSIEAAMAQGLTVGEVGGEGSAAADIRQLWQILARSLPQPPRLPRWNRKIGRRPRSWSEPASRNPGEAPPMQTIVVIRDHDGAESAVLAAHLAVQSIRSGAAGSRVALVDSTVEAPLVQWGLERPGEEPSVSQEEALDLPGELASLREAGARYCFVHLSAETAQSRRPLPDVDLYVLPLRADRPEEGSATELEVLRRLLEAPAGDGVPAAVVLCGDWNRNFKTALLELRDADVGIAGRVKWSDDLEMALRTGTTVIESRTNSVAAREFVELWTRLRKIMGGV